jgi:RNA polymerase sigma-70 factor (ECF subfamily)
MVLGTVLPKTDWDLIADFKGGREAAFTELVSRHKEKAVQLAYLAVGNYEDAKDLSQEAFVKVYPALKGFEMRAKFSTWFYRILMNTVKDFLRKKKWQRFLALQADDEKQDFLEKIVDAEASPGQRILNKELRHQMTQAIEKLPFKQKWIFTLRFLEGFALREIADATELSEGTVKATLHFAIQKFKKELRPYLSEERMTP